MSVNDEWKQFLQHQYSITTGTRQKYNSANPSVCSSDNNINTNADVCIDDGTTPEIESPECQDLYISTKTKVLFLSKEIDIYNIFWNIPIIEYWKTEEGVVKKQMKIVSKTPEEYEDYRQKLNEVGYYSENIIKQINNPDARRIKFKDERKITIGISKKDIMNCRGKEKNAFYNCFAMIVRFKYSGAGEKRLTDVYKEIHVKIFNTGKLEIPGVLDEPMLDIVKKMILDILQPNMPTPLDFIETDSEDNVLINSNFNCGYYINRDILHAILLGDKYNIESAFDPCSYPGVKCKYYFNNKVGFDETLQNGQILPEDRALKMSELGLKTKYTEISFMIFRTGSCLIVGNCSERVLKFVFAFIKKILTEEYKNIKAITDDNAASKIKKVKLRKKIISVSDEYYNELLASGSCSSAHAFIPIVDTSI